MEEAVGELEAIAYGQNGQQQHRESPKKHAAPQRKTPPAMHHAAVKTPAPKKAPLVDGSARHGRNGSHKNPEEVIPLTDQDFAGF